MPDRRRLPLDLAGRAASFSGICAEAETAPLCDGDEVLRGKRRRPGALRVHRCLEPATSILRLCRRTVHRDRGTRAGMSEFRLNTPVVLLLFARPDHTRAVLERVRQAQPPLLL